MYIYSIKNHNILSVCRLELYLFLKSVYALDFSHNYENQFKVHYN